MRLVMWAILAWFGLSAVLALAMIVLALCERAEHRAERRRGRREYDPSGVIDPLWSDFNRAMRRSR